jgi:hypothetical protein
MPFDLPSFALSPITVRAFNAMYRRHVPPKERADDALREVPVSAGRIHEWNRIYGRRGSSSSSVWCRSTAARARCGNARQHRRHGRGSFLAVLKAMGERGRGYLSFPAPATRWRSTSRMRPACASCWLELERITADHGGRVYLAKDASLHADWLPGCTRSRPLPRRPRRHRSRRPAELRHGAAARDPKARP